MRPLAPLRCYDSLPFSTIDRASGSKPTVYINGVLSWLKQKTCLSIMLLSFDVTYVDNQHEITIIAGTMALVSQHHHLSQCLSFTTSGYLMASWCCCQHLHHCQHWHHAISVMGSISLPVLVSLVVLASLCQCHGTVTSVGITTSIGAMSVV